LLRWRQRLGKVGSAHVIFRGEDVSSTVNPKNATTSSFADHYVPDSSRNRSCLENGGRRATRTRSELRSSAAGEGIGCRTRVYTQMRRKLSNNRDGSPEPLKSGSRSKKPYRRPGFRNAIVLGPDGKRLNTSAAMSKA
jgi:hypothetical protein